jgi:hypothetical protein
MSIQFAHLHAHARTNDPGASGILFRLRASETTEHRAVVVASSRAHVGVNRPAPTSVMWSPPFYADSAIADCRVI